MKTSSINLVSFLVIPLVFLCSCAQDNPTPSPTDPRANFIGRWSVSESWNKLAYEVNITASASSSTGVLIDNFANSGSGVKTLATVSGSVINISNTPQTLSNGWVIDGGSGSMQGTSKITWAYLFNDEANQYSANAIYTKQ